MTWEDVRAVNQRGSWMYEAYLDETALVRLEDHRLDTGELRRAGALA